MCLLEKSSNLTMSVGFPDGSEVKNPAANAGDLGSIPGMGRSSGERNGNPLHYSCLENLTDGRLHGFSESDTTERLHYICMILLKDDRTKGVHC